MYTFFLPIERFYPTTIPGTVVGGTVPKLDAGTVPKLVVAVVLSLIACSVGCALCLSVFARIKKSRQSAYKIPSQMYRGESQRIVIALLEPPSTVCTTVGRECLEFQHIGRINPPEFHDSVSPTCLEDLVSQNSAMEFRNYSHSSSSAADSVSTSSSESHPIALEIDESELYSLKVGTFDFMQPIGVLECGESGGVYHSSTHNFTITIPQGAVPNDTVIRIEVGVCLYGPFTFPCDHRPLSAILWLHVQNHTGFQFQKAVKITLQHCINIEIEEDCQLLELTFMKANCHADGRSGFEFSPAKGEYHFPVGSDCGTLCTTCFCFACITASLQRETFAKVNYSLVTVEPGLTSDVLWSVYFIMCYHLETCLQVGSWKVVFCTCNHIRCKHSLATTVVFFFCRLCQNL